MPAKADEHGFRYVVALEPGKEEQPATEYTTGHFYRTAELFCPQLSLLFEPDCCVRSTEVRAFEDKPIGIERREV